MGLSPFARVSASIWELGYTPIPLVAFEKRPGEWRGQQGWRGMDDWSRFQDEPVESWRLDIWSEWPDANIGVVHSERFIGIDFDNDPINCHDEIKAILADIEGAIVRRKGQKGYIQYFRCDGGVNTAVYRTEAGNALEVLGAGRQSVLPPSIHPVTKEPYVWLTEATLENVELSELPLLDPEHIDAIEEVLRSKGWDDRAIISTERNTEAVGSSYDRNLNNRALGLMDRWVPDLGLDKCRTKANGGWEAVPTFRSSSTGRPVEARKRSLKIDPSGIVDFGTGTPYSAIDLVMACFGCEFEQAWNWLFERVGEELAPWAHGGKKKRAAVPQDVSVASAKEVKEFNEQLGENLSKLSIPVAEGINPYDTRTVSGILRMVSKWCLARSIRPANEFAMMSALSIASTLFSRKFETPTYSGLNLYMVMIGGSGYGKDMPLRIPVDILTQAVGGISHLGGSDVTSDSAIERMVRQFPNRLLALDEIGMMISNMQNGKAQNWERRIKKTLLELYSKSSSSWIGKTTASIDDPDEPVFKPCLTVLGGTTPTELFDGLSESNMQDGMMARMIFVSLDKRPESADVTIDSNLPQDIAEEFERLKRLAPPGCPPEAVYMNCEMPSKPPLTAVVPWADHVAREAWLGVQDWAYKVEDDGIVSGGLINRAAENTLRLATIRALSNDPNAPKVTAGDVAWGAAIVERSIKMMFSAIQRYMYRSQNEKNINDLMEALRELNKKYDGPVTLAVISRKLRQMPRRIIEEILERLCEEGDVEWSEGADGNRGGTKAKYEIRKGAE